MELHEKGMISIFPFMKIFGQPGLLAEGESLAPIRIVKLFEQFPFL